MTRLHHTGMTVSDLDASVAFYRDVVGFEVVFTQEKRGGYLADIVGYPGAYVRMAHLALPGSDHRLELFQYLVPDPVVRRPEPRETGLTHVCLVVDDVDAATARLLAGGATAATGPVAVDTGANAGGRALYLRDPDGIVVELFQPPS
ncbi:MAG TPA: VOC family protein [Gaiellaceae bacterium]|jgi:catechol 2,3-dioxygenase-like lactoylglutathione lyase family enzyme